MKIRWWPKTGLILLTCFVLLSFPSFWAEGAEIKYVYDDMGRLVESVSPDAGMTRYLYDEAGNPVSKTDARGIQVDYHYDNLNRPISVSYPDYNALAGFDVLYTYDQGTDGIGRLTGIVDSSGETTFTYNARGRLTHKNVTMGALNFPLSRDLPEPDSATAVPLRRERDELAIG